MVRMASALMVVAASFVVSSTERLHAETPESDLTPPENERAREELLDAYIAGRLITAYALSEHLSPFTISVVVQNGRVILNGVVETAVQQDLAVEIARGVSEVQEVQSGIRVEPDAPRRDDPDESGFASRFSDVTITARIKTRLLWNANIGGRDIQVMTQEGIVTLTGRVQTSDERELAGQIALNTRGVRRVENRLMLDRPVDETLSAAD
jgi:osmotically-inducible protein OsmY